MYEVVHNLKQVSVVEFYDKDKKLIRSVPFKDVSFKFVGGTDTHNIKDCKNSCLCYNNIKINSDNFGEMYIFQDYGDDPCAIPNADYKSVNRELIIQGQESSIGYYKGHFVYIIAFKHIMLVYYLFEDRLPNLQTLYYKRPYSFSICTKNDKIYYYLAIRCEDYHEFLHETPYQFKDILSLDNVNNILSSTPNYFDFWEDRCEKYLTRDKLVCMGFSYSNGEWTKNGVTLRDDGVEYGPTFFYNNDYMFEVEELKKLLNEKK